MWNWCEKLRLHKLAEWRLQLQFEFIFKVSEVKRFAPCIQIDFELKYFQNMNRFESTKNSTSEALKINSNCNCNLHSASLCKRNFSHQFQILFFGRINRFYQLFKAKQLQFIILYSNSFEKQLISANFFWTFELTKVQLLNLN